jgi:hypothetical protein
MFVGFGSAKDMMNSLHLIDQLQQKMYCKRCKTILNCLMEKIEDEFQTEKGA